MKTPMIDVVWSFQPMLDMVWSSKPVLDHPLTSFHLEGTAGQIFGERQYLMKGRNLNHGRIMTPVSLPKADQIMELSSWRRPWTPAGLEFTK